MIICRIGGTAFLWHTAITTIACHSMNVSQECETLYIVEIDFSHLLI